MFNQFGDVERCDLRPGNVHSAAGWRAVLESVVARYRGTLKRLYFRGDAAFANPEIYEFLEAEGMDYAIRLPANRVLQDRIGYLLKRPVGATAARGAPLLRQFPLSGAELKKPRRVVAKLEWHPGELYPRVGFIVTNLARPAERVVGFYNQRGTAEQWINNAGIYQPAALMETDDALWQRHIQINQYGCFLGMKAVVPAMERSGGGSIVNISSVAGLKGSPGSFAYAATKWALRGMTKSAAIDLGGRKIRVNSVHPGPIDTDMIAFRTPEQREERMKQVPMHRHGTPEEVAQLVAFLLSDESSYITGAEIAIDGASSA